MSDFISREKLLAFPLRRNGAHCDKEHANMHFLNGIETVMEYAETLPAEEVAPVVHGRWIFNFSLDGSNFYRCSVCDRQEVLLAKESASEYFPYCHCGAKMDLEENL